MQHAGLKLFFTIHVHLVFVQLQILHANTREVLLWP